MRDMISRDRIELGRACETAGPLSCASSYFRDESRYGGRVATRRLEFHKRVASARDGEQVFIDRVKIAIFALVMAVLVVGLVYAASRGRWLGLAQVAGYAVVTSLFVGLACTRDYLWALYVVLRCRSEYRRSLTVVPSGPVCVIVRRASERENTPDLSPGNNNDPT